MSASRLSDTLSGRIAYDGTRTPVKAVLFLIVCAAWLLPGLVGHDPWKGDEAIVFGIVSDMLRSGHWVLARIAGEPWMEKAPLYYWVAGLHGTLFGWFLPLHDAMRLSAGTFMAITLTCMGLTARELMGERSVRIAVLLFIGCLGLLLRAHEMNTDLAGLSGIALGVYGLALSQRKEKIAGVVTGVALGVAFLGDGFLSLGLLAALMAALPLASSAWRTRAYATTAAIAVVCAIPLLALWPCMLFTANPALLDMWLSRALASRWSDRGSRAGLLDLVYFAKTLPWHAWPAWPLAAWSIWRARKTLATRTDLHLPFVAFLVFFVGLSLFAEAREVNALPMLVPLALLGVAEVDTLRRGAASALDWFGLTTFFLMAALIWIAWVAAITGSPEAVAIRIGAELPGFKYTFRFLPFAAAALLTLIWLAVVARSLRTTRRALVNWAAGITMVWMLMMTLGVPAIDYARSYRPLAASLNQALPVGYKCVISEGVGESQRALFGHYSGLNFFRPDSPAAPVCRIMMVQTAPSRVAPAGPGWTEIWRGSRPGDKSEVLVLYRRN
ncbi:ArnT family glycosyltransferase [Usitatibacter palustris]|uniref:Uncharacterized protein n=1 Tax=Usitatibacter palustris TaxID=2732487 RepID=A0A6M4H680_9PROT|nr:glycosyltransferase family 39 protein [Usitatibacter palustris]QJR13974.1 hypothetical protein DSM104440_00766 [Usitatibacter palustris]